jgi:4-azaleucine resistance transporter AzlC
MINRYKGAGKYKPYMIFALTDETYSLLCDEKVPDDIDAHLYRFLVSLFNHTYWIAGGIIGNLLGAVLPFSADGVAFSMTALFVAAFTEQWLNNKNHLPALTGILCTLVSLLIFGKENFLIPAMLMITAVLAVAGRKEVGKS